MRNVSYFPSYKWPYYVFFPQIRKLDQGSHTISNSKTYTDFPRQET